MRAATPSDGVLRESADGEYDWDLPDGRTLSFRGSWLVRIDYPGKAHLAFYYKRGRLARVTDEVGRVLALEYTEGRPGLEGYDTRTDVAAAGHLSRVILPDGRAIDYAYDNTHNLTRVSFADGTERRYHYEDALWPHQLTGITDRTGERYASWRYDEAGRASFSGHANGVERVALTYVDTAGGEAGSTVVTDSLGRTSRYDWRRAGDSGHALLLGGEGPGCATCPDPDVRYGYTDDLQVASATRPDGSARLHDHDPAGRLSSVRETAPDGTERLVVRYAYEGDVDPRPVLIARPSINPDGERTTAIERDADGLVTRVVERGFAPRGVDGTTFEPIERAMTFTHADGELVAVDGPREDVEDITRFTRDALGRMTRVTTPDGRTVTLSEFDADRRPTAFTIGEASPVRVRYDDAGRVSRVERFGRGIDYRHDAEGRLIGVTDEDGRVTRFDHDTAGRLVRVTDDLGRVTEIELDDESRLVGQRTFGLDGLPFERLARVFDAEGRLTSTRRTRNDADGSLVERTREHEYDEHDRLVALVDPYSGARVGFGHDAFGGIASVTGVDGSRARLARDAAGQDVAFIDPRGVETRHLKDDFGRTVAILSPDGGTRRFRLDPAGNPVEETDAAGRRVTRRWDAANRPVRVVRPDGTTTLAYHPDNGQLVRIENGTGVETFEHDADGHLLVHARLMDGRRFVTRYEHDPSGRLIRQILPDGQTLRFHYHEAGAERGQLRAVTRESLRGLRQETLLAEIDTDARDGTSGHIAHNGQRTRRAFAADGTPTSVETGQSLRLDYRFDANGNIAGIDENGLVQRYAYRSGRLSVASTILGDFAWRYDASGNRRASATRPPGEDVRSTDYRHDVGNRLAATTDRLGGERTTRLRDASGLPTRIGERRYEYDSEQRPVRVFDGDTLLAEYAYNGFGERVRKIVHDGGERRVTWFLYDGERLSTEIDGATDEMRQTVQVDGRAAIHFVGRAVYAVHTDHLGTPRLLSDADGEIVWRARYAPFGEATVDVERVRFEHRLPGQYHDAETGTHYNYRRDYDPATGRYLQPDPSGMEGGPNAFAYAANDPLARTDLRGLKPDPHPWQAGRDGTVVTQAQYERLTELAATGRSAEFHDLMHELTDHTVFADLAAAYRSGGLGPSGRFLESVFLQNGLPQIEHIGCVSPTEGIYEIPEPSVFVEAAFQAAGVKRAVFGFFGAILDFGVDIIDLNYDLSIYGTLGDLLRELYPDADIPAWVPSAKDGHATIEAGISLAEAIFREPSLIWDAIRDPIVADWAAGRYAEVVAGVVLEVVSLPLAITKGASVARLTDLLVSVRRGDIVQPGDFAEVIGQLTRQARLDGASLDNVILAAREAGVLDDVLTSGQLRGYELDDLVAAGHLTPEEAARAVTLPAPPFRPDFDEHVVRGERVQNARGDDVPRITSAGSISGTHNADNFAEVMRNPRGTQPATPGQTVDSEFVRNADGEVIGEHMTYRVPQVHGNGPDRGNPVRDADGNVVYKPAQEKTVYYPNVISDQQMLGRLEDAGTRFFDTNAAAMRTSGQNATVGTLVEDGLEYVMYLKTDAAGNVFVDNVHLKN